jgi:uncharacterized protein with ParB-like and HNH nuclease domain
MKIDVDEQTVEQFLKGGSTLLVVPDYQRPYSWENGQLEDFWNDLDTLDSDDIHFIGSIVLISESHIPGNFNKLEVVDGQQRLTTISILMKAIQDKYTELGEDDDAKSMDGYFYSEVHRRGKLVKLQPGKSDREIFDNLIGGNIDRITGTCIGDAYVFFKKKLESLEQLHNIFDKIVYRLSFVTIVTDSDKSAYRLFETLNDRGLDLSAVDLVKNNLLRQASEKGLNLDEIKNLWEGIIDNLEDIDKVRYFRQYLLSSKIVETRGKVTKEGLYDKFSEILKKIDNIPKFIDDVKKQSLLYNKIENSSIDDFDRSKDEEINIHLRNIEAIKATTSYTLLLRAFVELKRPEDILKLIELLETFAIRRNIVGTSTSDLDLIYNKLALDSFSEGTDWYEFIKEYLGKNMPTDLEFESKFKVVQLQQNDQTKYILDKLESEFGAGNKGKRVGNSFSVHIEHIAPQTMKDPSLWDGFAELDSDEQRECITSIGNLTLLEKKPNIKASNNSFEVKKEFYAESSTEMLMTNELSKYEKWGVEEIKERGERLAKMAVKIWKF